MQQNKPWVVVLAIALFTVPMWLSEVGLGVAFDPNSAEASRIGWSHRDDNARDILIVSTMSAELGAFTSSAGTTDSQR